MKFRIGFLAFLITGFLGCDSDDYPYADVPSVVLNKFTTVYPGASDVDFKEKDDHYEVAFELADSEAKVLIKNTGSIQKEKREISWDTMPKPVRKRLFERYEKRKLKNPEMVKWGDNTYYQVEISRFFRNQQIIIDAQGEIKPDIKYWE